MNACNGARELHGVAHGCGILVDTIMESVGYMEVGGGLRIGNIMWMSYLDNVATLQAVVSLGNEGKNSNLWPKLQARAIIIEF